MGLGVFAKEFIPFGATTRILRANQNMIVFKSKDDIPPLTTTTKKYLENYCGQTEDLCYILCPGSSLNHTKTEPNISGKKISNTGKYQLRHP